MAAGINSHGHRNSRNSNRSIWGHPLDQRKSLRAIILYFLVRKPIRQHGLGKKTYSGIWEHVIQLVTLAECNENAEVTITALPPSPFWRGYKKLTDNPAFLFQVCTMMNDDSETSAVMTTGLLKYVDNSKKCIEQLITLSYFPASWLTFVWDGLIFYNIRDGLVIIT